MCQIWSKLVQRFGRLCGPHIHKYIHINKCTHKQSSLIIKMCVCVYIACDSVDCIDVVSTFGLLSSPVYTCTNLWDPATASLVLNSVM